AVAPSGGCRTLPPQSKTLSARILGRGTSRARERRLKFRARTMCGFFGWISPEVDASPRSRARLGAALDALRPRGPDDLRLELGEGWALGHTRLAVLDLSERAAQPMGDGRGGWLVYNGEIYNFRELGRELEGRGIVFHSTGDSEVLLHALRVWGSECLPRLRGMFAFAWFDATERRLLLARDRYGVKPLTYRTSGEDVRFASDLFALRAMPGGGDAAIDADAARLYFALGYVPAPHSILKGYRKVCPGHWIEIRCGLGESPVLQERSYWTLAEVPTAGEGGGEDPGALCDEYERRAEESLRYRLISDVPVGSLLSGGIDSSLATALSRQVGGTDVTAFTMGFEEAEADESGFARAIAAHVGGKHEVFQIRASDVMGVWDRLWRVYDEPFADSSALPMVALCSGVRRHVKVALSGDGGDETACGYPWHWALHRLERAGRWPSSVRNAAAMVVQYLGPEGRYRGWALAARDRVERWMVLRTGLRPQDQPALPVRGGSMGAVIAHFQTAAAALGDVPDPLDWACRMDLATYLPDDLMVKADRASMSVGLELREPFLDHELTSWLLSLPVASRADQGKRKSKTLMRRALARRVPPELFERPKRGFTPPLRAWLNGPLADVARTARERFERGELDPIALPRGCRSWEECAARLEDRHLQFLWRLICFSEWKAAMIRCSAEGASRA
ncbi:MAG TPA: asparagine synthase (glutamine-hydrolyzing), partial [Verrucomicrobiae bacterium]|nr:asparagine synthase (glutamine-hydrolyzing) [Verrucomicrobiae bacterium]